MRPRGRPQLSCSSEQSFWLVGSNLTWWDLLSLLSNAATNVHCPWWRQPSDLSRELLSFGISFKLWNKLSPKQIVDSNVDWWLHIDERLIKSTDHHELIVHCLLSRNTPLAFINRVASFASDPSEAKPLISRVCCMIWSDLPTSCSKSCGYYHFRFNGGRGILVGAHIVIAISFSTRMDSPKRCSRQQVDARRGSHVSESLVTSLQQCC